MFVLDVTSRPQPNEVLNGYRDMQAGFRAADDRSYRRMQDSRALAQVDERTRIAQAQNDALMEFYRDQASPERQQRLLDLQTAADKERVKYQLELEKAERDRINTENPLGRYGLAPADLIEAQVADEDSVLRYESARVAADEANKLYNSLNQGQPYLIKERRLRDDLKKATEPAQRDLIQSKLDQLAAGVEAYNQALGNLNRSGFKVLTNGSRVTVAPPPMRMDAFRRVVPDLDKLFPNMRGSIRPTFDNPPQPPAVPVPQARRAPAALEAAPLATPADTGILDESVPPPGQQAAPIWSTGRRSFDLF